jgi:cyclic pyranopterin phosphate synthase
LLRHDLPTLIAQINGTSGIDDVALTTNGVLLARHATALRRAGLSRVTISLDTLQSDRFERFARSTRFKDVLEGIDALAEHGFERSKINTVLMRSFNLDELTDLLAFGWERDVEVRFIEYMDVGGATQWDSREVVSREEILDTIRGAFGAVSAVPNPDDPSAPAERFTISGGRTFGIIASTTAPFCRTCDRVRLTADGMMYLCLYADTGRDLRRLIRDGAADVDIVAFITEVWRSRSDRGAEERLETPGRGALYQIAGLRSDPHREMHTRGG